MSSLHIEIAILVLSSLAQLVAAGVAFYLMRFSGSHRYAWMCISLALFLMAERRIEPLYYAVSGGISAGFLSSSVGLAISLLMVVGVLGVRILFVRLRSQEHELQQLATTDSLTGLPNRRELLAQGRRETARHLRTQRPLALIMLDVDDFKRVNDVHGHPRGDEVLKQVAEACRSSLRAIDVVGRIGGDEFLAILPETPLPEARVVGERIRLAVMERVGPSEPAVSISVGIAALDTRKPAAGPAEALIEAQKRADQALYRAKAAGRNRVEISEAPVGESGDSGR